MTLSDDLKKSISEPRILWYASDCESAVDALSHVKSLVTDGPFVYRLKNGELICIWSTFTKCGYTEFVARSDNGDIDGNWSIDKKPLLKVDGGHGMIFKAKDGATKFIMHSPNVEGQERAIIYDIFEEDNTMVISEIS